MSVDGTRTGHNLKVEEIEMTAGPATCGESQGADGVSGHGESGLGFVGEFDV